MRVLVLSVFSIAISSALTGCSWGDSAPSARPSPQPHYPIAAGNTTVSQPGAILAGPIPKAEPLGRYGNPKTYRAPGGPYRTWSWERAKGYREIGQASWYGKKFHGRLTSSREVYDMNLITAAHKHLPIPCYARVTHLGNGRSIIVRVNDRGPFARKRIIDLSRGAATVLGMLNEGVADVEVVLLEPGTPEFLAAQRRGAPAPAPVSSAVATAAEIEALRPVVSEPIATPVARRESRLNTVTKSSPGDISQLPNARPILPRPPVDVVVPAPASGTAVVIAEPVAVPVRAPVPSRVTVIDPSPDVLPVATQAPAPIAAPSRAVIHYSASDHFVQVAMLTTEAEAIARAGQLVEQGLGPVRMVTTKIASQTVYQVRVGPFPSVGLAEQRQRALTQAGYARTFVLQVNQ